MRHTDRVFAAAVFSALAATFGGGAATARAQVTVDGTRDASGYTQVAVQTANTGFGDSNNITGSSGSELDNLSYNVDLAAGRLNLFLGGNLETNNNKLVLFFDTYAGGQNVMRSDNPNVNFNNLNTKYAGMTFDAGFSPDHIVSLSRDAGDGITTFGSVYVDYSQLRTNGGGRGGYVGKIGVIGVGTDQEGSGAPTDDPTTGADPTLLPMTLGVNDNNTAGVNGAQGTAADPVAAGAVNTGAELSLDLAALGIEGDFKLMAFINGSNHDFVSNQTLAGLPGTQKNLGGDGAGNFNGTVGGVNFANFAGDQFVTIPITIPTIAYNVNANGNYSTGSNFAGGVSPNGVNGRVLFGSAITAPRTVTVDQDVSLIRLTFDNANSYTLAGTNRITITGIGATPAVRVLSGNHTISAPVTLQNDTIFDTAANSSLTITQPLTAPTQSVFKQGDGSLTIAPGTLQSLTVNAGTLKLQGTGNTVVRGVTIAAPPAGAALDITNTPLIIDYDDGFSPLDTIKGYIHGTTTNTLISSNAGSGRGIGYVDSAAFPALVSYNGAPLDATALVVRQTLLGDTDLSRSVDFTDLLALAKNYGSTTGKEWYQGDTNYDGAVNFTDLLALAKNYNQSLTPSQAAELSAGFTGDFALAQALAPEPTVAFAGLMAAATLIGRRRK